MTAERRQELEQMGEVDLVNLAVERGVYVLGIGHEQLISIILSTETDAHLDEGEEP